ncbi:MAG TPA: hypothetical protein GXX18_11470 [Bacillales bacterium]|nr:hypothetical protein [Bacillales bacterium]
MKVNFLITSLLVSIFLLSACSNVEKVQHNRAKKDLRTLVSKDSSFQEGEIS